MTEILVADIGGTNARFALAQVANGRVQALGEPVMLKTADFPGLEEACIAVCERLGRPLPAFASAAIAGPIGDEVKLTNASWIIRPQQASQRLGLERLVLVNDFAALGHAVHQLGEEHLSHVCGPDAPLPAEGAVTVVGPGTGLGVGLLVRRKHQAIVVPTEGGHIDFAPLDEVEDYVLDALRARFGRVSAERLVSGPGLVNLYQALAALEDATVAPIEDKALWQAAMSGEDRLAAAALDRFCLTFGAVAGDLALAHGAAAVVLAGGVALRLGERLAASGFPRRFVDKGRNEPRMKAIPVRMIVHPQPGLFGAAAAFAGDHEG